MLRRLRLQKMTEENLGGGPGVDSDNGTETKDSQAVVKAITDTWRRKSQPIVLVATDTNINTAPRPSSDQSRRL